MPSSPRPKTEDDPSTGPRPDRGRSHCAAPPVAPHSDAESPSPDRVVAATHVVPEEADGFRLDAYAASVFAELPSRQSARKALRRGDLLLNGKPAQPQQPAMPGQVLELFLPARPTVPVYDFHFPVVLEDDFLALVRKPAGIPVSGNYARTVQRALPANLRPSTRPDALPWPRPVHRLDAPTGGLLLVAKTASASATLGHQFQARKVRKRYRAVLAGRIDGEGEITVPVDDQPAHTRFRTVTHTRSLHTEWVTTVDLWPRTGRTHQLRRHTAALGHPVVGDPIYGTPGRVFRGKGVFLWAVELAFSHPQTGASLDVRIDEPPKFRSYRQREARRWLAHHGKPVTDAPEGCP